jgi:hypothetical protein
VPAHLCQTHHCNPYATDPVTDINDLTLACGPNHKLAEQGWTTRKNAHGDTEWIPQHTSTTANHELLKYTLGSWTPPFISESLRTAPVNN